MWTKEDVQKVVSDHKLVIFAKGNKDLPMCGFSGRAIEIMRRLKQPFEVVNIFDDDSIRPALVEATGWPTTPQVFVNGDLIGGSDIALQLYESGKLEKMVEAAFSE